jgi:hypothetical protein
MEPGFKRFDEKLLSAYILPNIIGDLTNDNVNRRDLLQSMRYMGNLDVTKSYFTAAMGKLYYQSPYIIDGHEKLYGEESVFNFIKTLVDGKASGPFFKEFIQEKNGVVEEVECLRVLFL